MTNENPTKVVLKDVRLSYANIWAPKATQSGEMKYSCALLIPKDDKKNIAKIRKAIDAAKEAGKAKLTNKKGVIPSNLKTPLHDGDEDRSDDEVYAGHYFINANSNNAPQIVDRARDRINDQGEVYSGCYANVSVNFFAYNNQSVGIGCGLGNIQKIRDGERLGGGSTAEEDFDVLEEDDDFME